MKLPIFFTLQFLKNRFNAKTIMKQRNLYITTAQLSRFCNAEVENYNNSEDKSEVRIKLIRSIEMSYKTYFFISYIPVLSAITMLTLKEDKEKKIVEDFFFRLEKFMIENGKEA